MEIPSQMAVMTLPNVTLFPQALLPLYIFEPRYRRMLAAALKTHRTFVVAMQKPDKKRENPSTIAGLGLIRVAVDNPDGTTHLILQGLSRVELGEVVRTQPYRVQRIRPLETPPPDHAAIDTLMTQVRDLVIERVKLTVEPTKPPRPKEAQPSLLSLKEVVRFLQKLDDADQVADLVSCALLPRPEERQAILETVEVVPRLKQLIHFLMAEIREHRKHHGA